MERGVAVPCLPTMLRSEASLPLPDRPPPTRPSHDRIAEGTAVHQYISPPFCAGGVASLWLYRMPTPRIVGYRCWRIPSFRGKKNKEVGRRTGLFDVGALAGSRLQESCPSPISCGGSILCRSVSVIAVRYCVSCSMVPRGNPCCPCYKIAASLLAKACTPSLMWTTK